MAMNNNGGKGSASRPLSVSRQDYGNNFDAIFGKKKETENTVKVDLPVSGVTVTLKEPDLSQLTK